MCSEHKTAIVLVQKQLSQHSPCFCIHWRCQGIQLIDQQHKRQISYVFVQRILITLNVKCITVFNFNELSRNDTQNGIALGFPLSRLKIRRAIECYEHYTDITNITVLKFIENETEKSCLPSPCKTRKGIWSLGTETNSMTNK